MEFVFALLCGGAGGIKLSVSCIGAVNSGVDYGKGHSKAVHRQAEPAVAVMCAAFLGGYGVITSLSGQSNLWNHGTFDLCNSVHDKRNFRGKKRPEYVAIWSGIACVASGHVLFG